jgi:hypothetical protein
MIDHEKMLGDYFAYQHAMNAAWSWFQQSEEKNRALSAIVARVRAKCPDADEDDIRRDIEDRLSRRWRS